MARTMRGASIAGYGAIDEMISVRDDWPVPEAGPGELLIQVHAVALAPGDVRMLSGETRLMQKPRAFPYIGGGDCAGIVVAVGTKQSDALNKFDVGDEVYATFVSPNPLGCLAEYCVVQQALTSKKPSSLSFMEASTLCSSAVTAQTVVDTGVRRGDRVLVLGGTGGVGSFVVQLVKSAGASFVAATSSKPSLLHDLGADLVIDYTHQNWWEHPQFTDKRLDVIIDLVGGEEMWKQAKRCKVIKNARQGGRCITTTFDNPHMQIKSYSQALGFISSVLCRLIYTAFYKSIPAYTPIQGVPKENDAQEKYQRLNEKFQGDAQPVLRVVLDPAGPFSLTADGLKAAYSLQKSRHVHGKAVVQICD